MQARETVTAAEMGIEAVTHYRTLADIYFKPYEKELGAKARVIPISLARVRWLERPVEQLTGEGVEE